MRGYARARVCVCVYDSVRAISLPDIEILIDRDSCTRTHALSLFLIEFRVAVVGHKQTWMKSSADPEFYAVFDKFHVNFYFGGVSLMCIGAGTCCVACAEYDHDHDDSSCDTCACVYEYMRVYEHPRA